MTNNRKPSPHWKEENGILYLHPSCRLAYVAVETKPTKNNNFTWHLIMGMKGTETHFINNLEAAQFAAEDALRDIGKSFLDILE